jgi:hypothetical protein
MLIKQQHDVDVYMNERERGLNTAYTYEANQRAIKQGGVAFRAAVLRHI